MGCMRLASLFAVGVAFALASCGEADRPASRPVDLDRPVHAPTRPMEPVDVVDPATCRRLAKRLPGRALDRANELAHEKRCSVRVVESDGRHLPVTDDFVRSRINVSVEHGSVVDVVGLF